MPEIWRDRGGGVENLLLAAAQDLLLALSTQAPDGWRLELSRSQILDLVNSTLLHAAANPQWLTHRINGQPLLQELIRVAVVGLAAAPRPARLTGPILLQVLEQLLLAVARNPALLDRINWTTNDEETSILETAFRLIVSATLGRNEAYSTPAARRMALQALLDYALRAILSPYPDVRGLLLLELLLLVAQHQNEIPHDSPLWQRLLNTGMDILILHPELVAQPAVFQELVRDLAATLRSARQPVAHLLPEVIRRCLKVAAGHLEVLLQVRPGSPRILLALALEQSLRVLTRPGINQPWRPQFTDNDLLDVLDLVLATVVEHPEWTKNKFTRTYPLCPP
ncbi:MAG: hypothetical protein HC821_00065 [Lewinella sp.]|nr:hypothetical protein [Lewinella sp.]